MDKIMERRKFLKFTGASILTGSLMNMLSQPAPISYAKAYTQGAVKADGLPANWTCIHWEWEWPCWLKGAGEQFDAQAYVSGLLQSGVQMIHILTRAEQGFWHFPTEVGFERDCTGRDWLSEVLTEIRRRQAEDKIKVIFYFAASLDNSAAQQQPDWRQVDKDGVALSITEGDQPLWSYVCLNSPWRDYCFNVMNEVAERYGDQYSNVVGFYMDEPHFAQNGCYCMWCRDGFRTMCGTDLPRDFKEDRELWFNMHRFQVESVLRFLDDINNRVISKRPNLVWTYNGLSAPCLWNPRVWQVAPFNSMESELGYLWALTWSKQLASYNKPFELAFGRDNSWQNQQPRPAHELKTLQGISVAHGGGVLIGDSPYPDGRLRASGLTWGNELFQWKRAIQPWLDGARSLSEVALFESLDSNWVRFVLSFDQNPSIWAGDNSINPTLYVWAKLLAKANIQFDIINENNLSRLSRYKAVVLPDLPYLAESTIQALDNYVQAGGNLLTTHRTGFFDIQGMESPSSSLYDLLGARFRQRSSFKGNYLWINDATLARELSPEPVLIMGPALLCDVTTAQALAWVTFPIAEMTSETHVWFHYNPPRDHHESFPSVALNRRGRGQVLSIFHPLEDSVYKEDYWAAERLLLNALVRLVPERLIKITAPGEVIAVTSIQAGQQRVIVHLFNEAIWTGGRFLTNSNSEAVNGRQSPFPWKRPAVSNVQIELRAPFSPVRQVYKAPTRQDIAFQVAGGVTWFTVPVVDTHTIVVIE